MRAGIGEFLYSMTCLPSPFLVIVREKTGARQGPREVRPSPDHTSIGHAVYKQPTPPTAPEELRRSDTDLNRTITGLMDALQ